MLTGKFKSSSLNFKKKNTPHQLHTHLLLLTQELGKNKNYPNTDKIDQKYDSKISTQDFGLKKK